MGHYSTFTVGESDFLYTRNDYSTDLAALFTEADRHHVVGDTPVSDDDWEPPGCTFGYFTNAIALRERLSVHGFTARRALADLDVGVEQWRKTYGAQGAPREQQSPGENQGLYAARRPQEPADLLAAIGEAIRPHRPLASFATHGEYFQYETAFGETVADVQELLWFMDERSLIRLLIDQAADNTRVGLDLSGLTGCCVELNTAQPIATITRERQLASVPDNTHLIVLVEGKSDADLLTKAMQVTHPHLTGYVRFINYKLTKARGGVGEIPTMVRAFLAAGMANRFVAIVDNDGAGHDGVAKLKGQELPEVCRVMHYPDLPLLDRYPTVDPPSTAVTLTNVNGIAGSLEMYLGVDALTINGTLAPVELGATLEGVGRRQGGIGSRKKLVQQAFDAKVEAARAGRSADVGDWSGVRAIIDAIVNAFEDTPKSTLHG